MANDMIKIVEILLQSNLLIVLLLWSLHLSTSQGLQHSNQKILGIHYKDVCSHTLAKIFDVCFYCFTQGLKLIVGREGG